ncbi:MAG: hypothetical protein LDL29_04965, partial [Dechloromonas sp.]|nr:hypothetical protein [Dechloromonas sp.]
MGIGYNGSPKTIRRGNFLTKMSEKNIAIVGCSYRFPGDIDNAQSLWEALSGGKDLVSEIPAERW